MATSTERGASGGTHVER
uniref:Uncharacterized protein n=1 Tax=Anguilla anguilla TaxID=7936 RepID=A0A0E9W3Y6_ANGAN